MFNYLQIKEGRVVGTLATPNRAENDNLVEFDEASAKHLGMVWNGAKLLPKPVNEVIAEKITDIKNQASARIQGMDWQVERSKERAELANRNPMSDTEYRTVLQDREDIRQASNAAETAVNLLTAQAEIEAFTW